jgi:hypothetical protein
MENSQPESWGWANLIESKLKKITTVNSYQSKCKKDEIKKNQSTKKKTQKNKTLANLGKAIKPRKLDHANSS